MKEFIDKLISRLEEESDYEPIDYDYCDMSCSGEEHFISTHKAISIINELAEGYNNGWIPYVDGCKMPNEASMVWLSFTTPIALFVKSAWYINGHFEWDNCRKVKETPTAWKPFDVPAPYTEGE